MNALPLESGCRYPPVCDVRPEKAAQHLHNQVRSGSASARLLSARIRGSIQMTLPSVTDVAYRRAWCCPKSCWHAHYPSEPLNEDQANQLPAWSWCITVWLTDR